MGHPVTGSGAAQSCGRFPPSSKREPDEGFRFLVPTATPRTRDLPLTRRLLFLLSYAGMISLRLCSSASAVPRLKRSRCTRAGVPAAHIQAVPALPGTHARPLCRSTPAMRLERIPGIEPGASTMAWSRSAC
jgi:hypothetical protein